MDPEGFRWGFTEELLATLLEVVDFGNRQFIAANIDPKSAAKVPDPIEISRPWKKDENVDEQGKAKPKTASPEEVKNFFRRMAG